LPALYSPVNTNAPLALAADWLDVRSIMMSPPARSWCVLIGSVQL
jgi:hypothetical protein